MAITTAVLAFRLPITVRTELRREAAARGIAMNALLAEIAIRHANEKGAAQTTPTDQA